MSSNFSKAQPKEFLDAAIETALEAGKILREEYALPPDIHYKGDVDLVTQADKRSERAIVARRPKTRYLVTPSARIMVGLRAMLPDRTWDALLRRSYPEPGRSARAASAGRAPHVR